MGTYNGAQIQKYYEHIKAQMSYGVWYSMLYSWLH